VKKKTKDLHRKLEIQGKSVRFDNYVEHSCF